MTALLATAAIAPAIALAGGGSDNTAIEVTDTQSNDDGELAVYGKVHSSSKCAKGRPLELVLKVPGKDAVVDKGESGKRGGYTFLLRKSDFDQKVDETVVSAKKSQAGDTTCKAAQEVVPVVRAAHRSQSSTRAGLSQDSIEVTDADSTEDGDVIFAGKLHTSNKCQKERPMDLVIERPGDDKVVDTTPTSKRGGFGVIYRKGDPGPGATGAYLKTVGVKVGDTKCERVKEEISF